ncbi:MAG: Rho termination factor N-terminal domain-containing protein, partial [Dehalococcoidia bacterium]|nr:Rho termination factor N-terminal domain-containing protein [Dehalococcoidia bacterium]
MSINITELESKTREELLEIAKELGISGYTALKKHDLVLRLLQTSAELQGNLFGGGVLEIMDEGYGFLRQDNLRPGASDVYVSQSQIRRFGLRTGDAITGQMRLPRNGEKYYSLLRIEAVNGIDPEQIKNRPHFNSLTPTFPERFI